MMVEERNGPRFVNGKGCGSRRSPEDNEIDGMDLRDYT